MPAVPEGPEQGSDFSNDACCSPPFPTCTTQPRYLRSSRSLPVPVLAPDTPSWYTHCNHATLRTNAFSFVYTFFHSRPPIPLSSLSLDDPSNVATVAVSPSAIDNLLTSTCQLVPEPTSFHFIPTNTPVSQHDSSLLAFTPLSIDVQIFSTRRALSLNTTDFSSIFEPFLRATRTQPRAQTVFVVLFNWLAQPFSRTPNLLRKFFVGYLVSKNSFPNI